MFFQALKQNLRIKIFVGTSSNAVRTQVWTALIAMLLLRYWQLRGRCCMIQLRREWGRFSNFSFRTPQRRISAYRARPSG